MIDRSPEYSKVNKLNNIFVLGNNIRHEVL